jgi:hypothetical protein
MGEFGEDIFDIRNASPMVALEIQAVSFERENRTGCVEQRKLA